MKVRSIQFALLALLLSAPVTAASVQVKRGDTVSTLAQRHGTTVQAILNANPGLVPERLTAGRTITVPTAAQAVVRPAGIRVSAVLPVQGRVTTAPNAAHVGLDLAARSGTVIRAAMSGTVTLEGEEGRYLARVVRAREGERVTATDGHGRLTTLVVERSRS